MAWGLLGIDPSAEGRNDPPAPDIDAERERFAAFAEEWLRNGEGIATIIRQQYGREEDVPDSDTWRCGECGATGAPPYHQGWCHNK